jgi:hypothetical protein
VETVLHEGGDDLDRARADGPGPALRERLAQFETLKREQTEMARLAVQYAKEQQALKNTEHALGTLVGHVGMHEPRRNMSDCLSLAADTGNDGSAGIDPAADPVSDTEEPSRPSVSEGNRLRGQRIVMEEVVEDEEGERDRKKSEGHSHLRAVAGADGRRGRRVSDIKEREGEVFQRDSPAHQGRVLLDLPATNGVDSDGNGSPGGREGGGG